jgi:fructose-1,6-bisphosphatase I
MAWTCLVSHRCPTALSHGGTTRQWACPRQENICAETGVTLSRYMMEMARENQELAAIESIFSSISTATKTISSLVRRAYLTGKIGMGGNINVQGEEQKKLDVISNDVFKRALQYTGKIATIASEEEESPILVDNRGNKVYSGDVIVDQEGGYVAVFDPLDGSSNIDAGIPVGTIFGIFSSDEECPMADGVQDDWDGSDAERRCLQSTLQPGRNLVAAGYCLYSSSTTLVFTLGSGVHGFTLDETIGEFILTQPNIKIPKRGSIYSFNQANHYDWDQPLQDYITDLQHGRGDTQTRYSSRYVGSMVADVHRTLMYGGIFGYPADKQNPDGKLRLLYEAAPMSFLVEQAGGLALTGKHRIMDLTPRQVHQRVPCILGSSQDVEELRRYYDCCDDPNLISRCEERLKISTLVFKYSSYRLS